jgi:putative membrane protein
MSIKLSLMATVAGTVLWASSASAGDDPGQHFLTEAIRGNLAEIKIGDLAEHKGASQAVKDFGATLAKDHAKANEKAQQAAASVGMKTPSQADFKEQTTYVELAALSGEAFDRHFIQSMVKDHEEDIAKYQNEARSGSGPAAAYARSILPDLRKHLEMAQRLQQETRTASAPSTK